MIQLLKKYFLYVQSPFNKVIKSQKKIIRITHHGTPNGIQAYILSHMLKILHSCDNVKQVSFAMWRECSCLGVIIVLTYYHDQIIITAIVPLQPFQILSRSSSPFLVCCFERGPLKVSKCDYGFEMFINCWLYVV